MGSWCIRFLRSGGSVDLVSSPNRKKRSAEAVDPREAERVTKTSRSIPRCASYWLSDESKILVNLFEAPASKYSEEPEPNFFAGLAVRLN